MENASDSGFTIPTAFRQNICHNFLRPKRTDLASQIYVVFPFGSCEWSWPWFELGYNFLCGCSALKKKCLLNKIVLHHKMSCCVAFISLLNIGLLNVSKCDYWFCSSERWQWCKKSDYVQIQHLFFPDSSFHKGMVALSHASVWSIPIL